MGRAQPFRQAATGEFAVGMAGVLQGVLHSEETPMPASEPAISSAEEETPPCPGCGLTMVELAR